MDASISFQCLETSSGAGIKAPCRHPVPGETGGQQGPDPDPLWVRARLLAELSGLQPQPRGARLQPPRLAWLCLPTRHLPGDNDAPRGNKVAGYRFARRLVEGFRVLSADPHHPTLLQELGYRFLRQEGKKEL